jgi:chemotaxis signal transduction protein
MTGEEVFAPRDGHIWVMDLATRLLYEATDLGIGRLENAVVIDLGRTDTIAAMLSD